MTDSSTRPKNLSIGVTLVGLLLFAIGLVIMKKANCSAIIPALTAGAVTAIFGAIAMGRSILSRRQAQEEHDAAEYHRSHGATDLFEDADEAVRLATKASAQYVKFFVPFSAVFSGLVLLFFSLGLWRNWSKAEMLPLAPNPLPMAILAVACCIGTLIAGSFFVGVSREKGCRWLRPSGAWLFLTGFLFMLGAIALFCEFFKKAINTIDLSMGKLGVVILAVLAVELIISFIVEFYRPRMPGEEERPLLESRLLALFTEPGGVARNVAASLDYQFGFQVSEAWFYRFLERTVVPLFAIMVIIFWLMTCIVVIETGENGIREKFGQVSSREPLPPGLYFKLPLPFERITRFPVEHVQEITIGGHDEEEEEGHDDAVIVWDIKEVHDDEANFIVADNAEDEKMTEASEGKSYAGGLNLGVVSAHIPMYFKVKDLYKYSYLHQDAGQVLKNLASRELVRYLASANFKDILGSKRIEATTILNERIQKAADEADLGIEVLFVGLSGLHPPFGVGSAYDNVVASKEMQYEQILLAQAYATIIAPRTAGIAKTLIDNAEAYRLEREQVPQAEGERFLSQLKSYEASPELFLLSSYLDVIVNEGRSARKYVLATRDGQETLILNLEKKIRSSLLDLNMSNADDTPQI